MIIKRRQSRYLKDVLYVVSERIDGVVRENEPVLDQIEHLNNNHVVDLFRLERILRHKDA